MQGQGRFSRLLQERIVFLGTPIDDNVGNLIMAQLLHLESEDPEKDINLINLEEEPAAWALVVGELHEIGRRRGRAG